MWLFHILTLDYLAQWANATSWDSSREINRGILIRQTYWLWFHFIWICAYLTGHRGLEPISHFQVTNMSHNTFTVSGVSRMWSILIESPLLTVVFCCCFFYMGIPCVVRGCAFNCVSSLFLTTIRQSELIWNELQQLAILTPQVLLDLKSKTTQTSPLNNLCGLSDIRQV